MSIAKLRTKTRGGNVSEKKARQSTAAEAWVLDKAAAVETIYTHGKIFRLYPEFPISMGIAIKSTRSK